MPEPRTFGSLGDDRQTGVYRVRNTLDGKMYVGSATSSFNRRWATHRRMLASGRHHSIHLQRAWNLHGPLAFVFEIVERTEPAHAVAQEQVFLSWWKAADPEYGYNICSTAGNTLGRKSSAETRAKQSKAHALRNYVFTDEHRAKISASKTGKKHTAEALAKMSQVKVGKTLSAAARAKLSAANIGRKHTAEACAKIAAAKRGKRLSAAWRLNISRVQLGKKMSTAARENMCVAQRERRRLEKSAIPLVEQQVAGALQ